MRARFVRYGSVRLIFDFENPALPDSVAGAAHLMQFRAVKVPGGLTFYMDSAGGDSDLAEARDPVPAGTAGKLVVESSLAPGASQTFAYTVLKNGVATSLTVTLSGASETKKSIAVDVAYANEDTLALQLVTSAGAAQAKHKATIKYTPT